MLYALWDTKTINLVDSYDNLLDALKLVLSGIERNGLQDADTLALDVEDEQGHVTPIAHGRALADLARHELRSSQPA